MSKYSIENTTLTAIADAVREQEGSSELIPVTELAARIAAIVGGGEDLEFIMGETSSQWFPSTLATNAEFWEVLPNGFDDIEVFILYDSTASSSKAFYCFPQYDAQYKVAANEGTIIYPFRGMNAVSSSGWDANHPFSNTSSGYGYCINKATQKTAGAYTNNQGAGWSVTGVGSSGSRYLAIKGIPGQGGGEAVIEALEIIANGVYEAPEGVDGYSPITVNVPDVPAVVEALQVTENGTYTPGEGVDGFNSVVVAVEGGGYEIPPEAFILTGNCAYRFANSGWDWFLESYGDQITSENVTDLERAFSTMNLSGPIPIAEINVAPTWKSANGIFSNSFNITSVPLIKGNLTPQTSTYTNLNLGSLFGYCRSLQELPDDYFSHLAGDEFWALEQTKKGPRNSIFNYCYSLRRLPDLSLLNTSGTTNSISLYYNLGSSGYVLDEITNLPVHLGTVTSNMFSSTAQSAHRLKDFIFATNEDGTAKTANWKGQILDLSKEVGFEEHNSSIGKYPYTNAMGYKYGSWSGISEADWIHDDTSFQANKDNPNAFVYESDQANPEYWSRYDKGSALRTINSLPDTSAYLATASGTNTIKFLGTSGTSRDAGAINTLTEEEIAVATAKGWTVTFVE